MSKDTWQGCTPDGKPPVVGTVYRVEDQRKGTFSGRCLRSDPTTWATLLIVKGEVKAILPYNVRETGEEVTVRSSLCRMTPQAETLIP